MVRGTARRLPGGPPVVKAALGYEISKEELGEARIHAEQSGVVDNAVESEQEAFAAIRRFLSYLPPNVWELPPRGETSDDQRRRDERLLSLAPRNPRHACSAHTAIDCVVDRGSFFEIAPADGRARITDLARRSGYAVGIMANDPCYGGLPTSAAATRLCGCSSSPTRFTCR